ncbi:hypothetical protein [uncultured Mediterranean phage uvMED]|nr:hypothetical protein [uncultured Mediterranean phage uvMED]
MTIMTNQQRVADYKARLRKKGIINVSVQIHKDDAQKLKDYAKKLLEKRKQKAS